MIRFFKIFGSIFVIFNIFNRFWYISITGNWYSDLYHHSGKFWAQYGPFFITSWPFSSFDNCYFVVNFFRSVHFSFGQKCSFFFSARAPQGPPRAPQGPPGPPRPPQGHIFPRISYKKYRKSYQKSYKKYMKSYQKSYKNIGKSYRKSSWII